LETRGVVAIVDALKVTVLQSAERKVFGLVCELISLSYSVLKQLSVNDHELLGHEGVLAPNLSHASLSKGALVIAGTG
jgi:hypothetical protein